MNISGDLTPILGAPIVQIEHVDLLKNENIANAIDELGRLSAQTRQCNQHLRYKPATSCEKLLSLNNTLYLAWDYDNKHDLSQILGILRVGQKQLYLFDNNMISYEGNFVCVLDFYVHYSVQQRGIGTRLFEFMMQNRRIEAPYQIAFDNPSVPLLRFLSKKYDLNEPIWQNTSYVVFPQLFQAAQDGAQHDSAPPEGWQRSSTPRPINNDASKGSFGARFLDNAISGHPAARKARLRQTENEHFTLGCGTDFHVSTARSTSGNNERSNASLLQNEARQRKQHVLSSKPLW